MKPANSGSSVGIHKVTNEKSLPRALAEASRYDTKLLVEKGIDAREIEVAVLGNEEPEASVPGEIRPRRDWYDYEAKYVDDSTELLVPAPISDEESERVRDLALRAYRTLEGAGLRHLPGLFLANIRRGDEVIRLTSTEQVRLAGGGGFSPCRG